MDKETKYEDIPKYLRKLMSPCTNLDSLDEVNQMSHIRFRVQHEIDLYEDEHYITLREYCDAKKFMILTGGKM